ncbi:cytochrome c oxidase polypeptide VI [Ramicandelaber brevisporus]|nr:cytochrome c oxidase polypeptide VI [Ramicandelaber brevisporus]
MFPAAFTRASTVALRRTAAVPSTMAALRNSTSLLQQKRYYSEHAETYEEFNARYTDFFKGVDELFELQRGLNNCFAYDMVPNTEVIKQAVLAARRVNDFPTAVRIFEGLKTRIPTEQQYKQYLDELKPLREELGVNLKEELFA